MPKTLVLLPGWGLGIKPLNALAEELKKRLPSFTVQLQPLPNMAGKNIHTVIKELNHNLPKNCWLAGWSLGGMLATAVAANRNQTTATNSCTGLISLASNACFVANSNWQNAMPASTFTEFYTLCKNDLATGLKRFTLLCSQGAEQARQLSRQLQAMALTVEPASTLVALELLAGLKMLAKLDNRAAITSFSGPQLHLFSEADALVPVETATEIQALNACSLNLYSLNPKVTVEVLGQSHASVLAEPQLLAKRISAFILSNQNA